MKKLNQLTGAMCALALAAGCGLASAQPFTPEQYKSGQENYARHCSACHGAKMKNPEGAFDLPTFPKDGKERFIRSVSKGRNSMPPWEGLLKPEEIEALWAYVHTGDK